MRIRLASSWDWKIPGKRGVVAFPAGDFVMTAAQGAQAVADGVGSELPEGAEHAPPKRKRRGPRN